MSVKLHGRRTAVLGLIPRIYLVLLLGWLNLYCCCCSSIPLMPRNASNASLNLARERMMPDILSTMLRMSPVAGANCRSALQRKGLFNVDVGNATQVVMFCQEMDCQLFLQGLGRLLKKVDKKGKEGGNEMVDEIDDDDDEFSDGMDDDKSRYYPPSLPSDIDQRYIPLPILILVQNITMVCSNHSNMDDGKDDEKPVAGAPTPLPTPTKRKPGSRLPARNVTDDDKNATIIDKDRNATIIDKDKNATIIDKDRNATTTDKDKNVTDKDKNVTDKDKNVTDQDRNATAPDDDRKATAPDKDKDQQMDDDDKDLQRDDSNTRSTNGSTSDSMSMSRHGLFCAEQSLNWKRLMLLCGSTGFLAWVI